MRSISRRPTKWMQAAQATLRQRPRPESIRALLDDASRTGYAEAKGAFDVKMHKGRMDASRTGYAEAKATLKAGRGQLL